MHAFVPLLLPAPLEIISLSFALPLPCLSLDPAIFLVALHFSALPEWYFTAACSFSLPSQRYLIGKCHWEMGLLPVQLSDKHRWAPFDWPDAENAIVLLHFILYSSKYLDLLHLFYTGSYVWLLAVAAGVSSWLCFSVTFWLSELCLKLNRISIFPSSLLNISVPEVLCMAGEKKN